MHRHPIASILFLSLVATACGGRTSAGDSNDNTPPDPNAALTAFTAEITRPRAAGSYLVGETIRLQAAFSEGDYAVSPDTLSWSSSIDGDLGTTNPLDATLTEGSHTVRVQGTFDGRSAQASLGIEVTDFAVRIDSPRDGGDATIGEVVRFDPVARILDGNGDPLTLTEANPDVTFAWTSSLDGTFAPILGFYDGLSLGTHTITLTVTYAPTGVAPRTASASLTLIVHEPNHDPVASIDAPVDCPNAVVEQGTATTFSGSITDVDAWDSALAGSWIDSIAGNPAAGATFVLPANAALGLHQITFSVTDTYGANDDTVCDVYVVAPGTDASSLYPDTTAITDTLANGVTDLRFIGADPAGLVWIGSTDGLTVLSGEPPATYDGAEVDLGGGNMTVLGAAFYTDGAAVATSLGLTFCSYAAGALSACTAVDAGANDYFAVATAAGVVAAASDKGLVLASAGDASSAVRFDEGNSNLPADAVRDVLFADGVLYVATDAGLCIIDNAAAALANTAIDPLCNTVLRESNGGLGNNDVTALADGGDVIWVGTDGGLARYYPATGASVQYEERGFGGDRVNDIAIDANGIVWIATNEGVTRLDPSLNLATHFSGTDLGLDNARVRSIFIAADGTKWFGGDAGLVQYIGP